MAPQKEENKKQKHSHRKLSKLAIKRLMREKRALQNVPHDAEIPEDLNINVDQAGDDVLEFIEPVINDICDSDNSNKNEPTREAEARSTACRSNVRFVVSSQSVLSDVVSDVVSNVDPALPGPVRHAHYKRNMELDLDNIDNIISVTPITTATSFITTTTTTTTTTNINTRSSARVAARTVVTSEARDLLSDAIYF